MLFRSIETKQERLELGDEVLSIAAGEFAWSKESTSPTLEDINLSVKKGELVGVLGRVGAGKVCIVFTMSICSDETDGSVD